MIGERCERTDDFQKEKPHMEGYKRCHADDVHENHHFIEEKNRTWQNVDVKILFDDNFFVQFNFRVKNLFRFFHS